MGLILFLILFEIAVAAVISFPLLRWLQGKLKLHKEGT
jgi:hypothetical protein